VRKQLVAIMDRYKLDLVSGEVQCPVLPLCTAWRLCIALDLAAAHCGSCKCKANFDCYHASRRLNTYHFPFLGAFTPTFATLHTHPGAAGRSYQKIQKAICSGFFFHAARKDAQDGYKTGGWDAARLDGLEHCC
jgi:hypothetical protein